jgi:hypothetical protein
MGGSRRSHKGWKTLVFILLVKANSTMNENNIPKFTVATSIVR